MSDFERVVPQTGEVVQYDPAEIARSDVQANTAMAAVDQTRALTEVKAQMSLAKMFPRDHKRAEVAILRECERYKMAVKALYTYRRGGTMVEGESIRLMEVMARHWGNINYGFREVSHEGGRSEVEAFSIDLETNTRIVRSFFVNHIRDAHGDQVKLKSQRDIYEHIAAQAQRRVRAVISELIPGDLIDRAKEKCRETMKKGDGRPFQDRVTDMLVAYENYGVTRDMIENLLEHAVDSMVPEELAKLTEIYTSIKDQVADRAEFFDLNARPWKEKLKDRAKEKGKTKPKEDEKKDEKIDVPDVPDDLTKFPKTEQAMINFIDRKASRIKKYWPKFGKSLLEYWDTISENPCPVNAHGDLVTQKQEEPEVREEKETPKATEPEQQSDDEATGNGGLQSLHDLIPPEE